MTLGTPGGIGAHRYKALPSGKSIVGGSRERLGQSQLLGSCGRKACRPVNIVPHHSTLPRRWCKKGFRFRSFGNVMSENRLATEPAWGAILVSEVRS